ncbi:hypothetical protein RIF29_15363 [Crotalaria pallida]|uniref:Fe-S metabolism associated domain-containing protein n=1 Tax=Crotalaria pallida TaxID=3830 RepID=A0AAN9FEQ7_CROPI
MMMMYANPISTTSFRILTSTIPLSRLCPKTSPFLLTPTFKPISFQKLPPSKPPSATSSSSSSTPSTSLQPISSLPPKLQQIITLFQSVQEPKAKYEQLLFYGKNLQPLHPRFKTTENKVQGCVSQVWVRAYLDPHRNVFFEADSDSVLTKGLAALLVNGLSGEPVDEVIRVSPDFVTLLGLQQSLTPSRNNGFLNMLKLMQRKALSLYVEAEKNGGGVTGEVGELTGGGDDNVSVFEGANDGSEGLSSGESVEVEVRLPSADDDDDVDVGLGGRGKRIKERLEKELVPVELEIEDVSYQHAGHAGVRGSGDGETHFNLKVVSEKFEGKSLVKRHRLIYSLLQEELETGLHALSIVAKTPSEVSQG